MNYFVISDIHGHIEKLDALLPHWNPDYEQLVLLGDYIDRGPDPLAVLERVYQLKTTYGAIVNRGNHEEMFTAWLENPDDPNDYYYQSVGVSTILSFLQAYPVNKPNQLPYVLSPRHIRDYIQETYPHLMQLLEDMTLYYETSSYIFVHAGFNPFLRNWKNSSRNDFLWIRQPFLFQKNETGKIAVVGHTNTSLLHSNREETGVWIDPWQSKIVIDGGAGSHRNLNGVVLHQNGDLRQMKVIQV